MEREYVHTNEKGEGYRTSELSSSRLPSLTKWMRHRTALMYTNLPSWPTRKSVEAGEQKILKMEILTVSSTLLFEASTYQHFLSVV